MIPTSHSTVSTAPPSNTPLAVHVSPHSPAPLSFTIGTPSSDTRKQIRNRHSNPPSCSPSPASLATRKAGTPSEGISSANVVRPVCAVCESWCSPCTLRKPNPLPVVRKRAGSDSCASNRTQTCDTLVSPCDVIEQTGECSFAPRLSTAFVQAEALLILNVKNLLWSQQDTFQTGHSKTGAEPVNPRKSNLQPYQQVWREAYL
jgi:hypothetical protein